MYRVLLLWCGALGVCGAWARPRDAALLRTLPTVTNSLLNLGKMDIAFYINTKPQDSKPEMGRPTSLVSDAASGVACPCSGVRPPPPRAGHLRPPADMLASLLTNNDLFSFREPAMSPLCCDSHEQVREDSIVFEFGPKQSQVFTSPVHSNHFAAPAAPSALDLLAPHSPGQLARKQKFFELFIFPNRKEIALDLGKLTNKHDAYKDIKIVGDKEIRNDFKTMKLSPPLSSSVKKDLTVQENKSKTAFNAPDNANAISNTSKVNVV